MKLHDNQRNLIRHLIRFNILDYDSCLKMLDTENTGDKTALSYVFRPLTKNKYISKNKQGIVNVLRKGRELFTEEEPLISTGTSEKSRLRVLQVSKMAALMEKNGIPSFGELQDTDDPYFIPSACWRNIADGILSTTRFTGMLLAYDKKYAVYDIGDGTMEWQVRAESSLFYRKYGSYETCADGMILICDDDMREKIAENIIRQTMWNRRTLLDEHYSETDKPVRYSRAPIKLRIQYEHVYLTTPALLAKSLRHIYGEDNTIAYATRRGTRIRDPKMGDVEAWPIRYFVNPAYDLLKLVYFFSTVKAHLEHLKDDISSYGTELQYVIVMQREDLPILKMYPDVFRSEKVSVNVFKSKKDTERH